MRLSEDRAVMVKNHLVLKNVDVRRITTLGFGESQPMATNATPEGRAMNRRVEIELRPQQQVRESY
jgi:outer membrane protein OmpA-like peptidoglycan-associated protein